MSSFVRPSPNELSFKIEQEKEKRRKLRLKQVRIMASNNAGQVRELYQKQKNAVLEKLAIKIQKKINEKDEILLSKAKEDFEKNLERMGEAHKNTNQIVNQTQDYTNEQIRMTANAAERFQLAVDSLRDEQLTSRQESARLQQAREQSKFVERTRAAHVASLPQPRPAPYQLPGAQNDASKKFIPICGVRLEDDAIRLRENPTVQCDRASTTPEHAEPTAVNDRAAFEAAASEEQLRHLEIHQKSMELQDMNVRAQVRGHKAMHKELVRQNHQQLLALIENQSKQDFLHRQKEYSRFPNSSKNVGDIQYGLAGLTRQLEASKEHDKERAVENLMMTTLRDITNSQIANEQSTVMLTNLALNKNGDDIDHGTKNDEANLPNAQSITDHQIKAVTPENSQLNSKNSLKSLYAKIRGVTNEEKDVVKDQEQQALSSDAKYTKLATDMEEDEAFRALDKLPKNGLFTRKDNLAQKFQQISSQNNNNTNIVATFNLNEVNIEQEAERLRNELRNLDKNLSKLHQRKAFLQLSREQIDQENRSHDNLSVSSLSTLQDCQYEENSRQESLCSQSTKETIDHPNDDDDVASSLISSASTATSHASVDFRIRNFQRNALLKWKNPVIPAPQHIINVRISSPNELNQISSTNSWQQDSTMQVISSHYSNIVNQLMQDEANLRREFHAAKQNKLMTTRHTPINEEEEDKLQNRNKVEDLSQPETIMEDFDIDNKTPDNYHHDEENDNNNQNPMQIENSEEPFSNTNIFGSANSTTKPINLQESETLLVQLKDQLAQFEFSHNDDNDNIEVEKREEKEKKNEEKIQTIKIKNEMRNSDEEKSSHEVNIEKHVVDQSNQENNLAQQLLFELKEKFNEIDSVDPRAVQPEHTEQADGQSNSPLINSQKLKTQLSIIKKELENIDSLGQKSRADIQESFKQFSDKILNLTVSNVRKAVTRNSLETLHERNNQSTKFLDDPKNLEDVQKLQEDVFVQDESEVSETLLERSESVETVHQFNASVLMDESNSHFAFPTAQTLDSNSRIGYPVNLIDHITENFADATRHSAEHASEIDDEQRLHVDYDDMVDEIDDEEMLIKNLVENALQSAVFDLEIEREQKRKQHLKNEVLRKYFNEGSHVATAATPKSSMIEQCLNELLSEETSTSGVMMTERAGDLDTGRDAAEISVDSGRNTCDAITHAVTHAVTPANYGHAACSRNATAEESGYSTVSKATTNVSVAASIWRPPLPPNSANSDNEFDSEIASTISQTICMRQRLSEFKKMRLAKVNSHHFKPSTASTAISESADRSINSNIEKNNGKTQFARQNKDTAVNLFKLRPISYQTELDRKKRETEQKCENRKKAKIFAEKLSRMNREKTSLKRK